MQVRAFERYISLRDTGYLPFHFNSRAIGYYQFYFYGYMVLFSIFWLLSGILNI